MLKNFKKSNKMIIALLISIGILISIVNYSDAASFSITSGISEITVGKTYNIRITAAGLTGKFNITHSDNVSVNVSNIWVENGVAEGTITVTTKKEGKATVTVTPDSEFGVSDANGLVSLSAKTDTVTVKPKVTQSSGTTNNDKKEEEKPTFKSVNQTVYCTDNDVNVRSSYSTSSSALGQLDKGDSVTRTGTATVDGRAWSRITYNGKTAYVVSQFLSTTKPVIEEKNEEEEEESTKEKSSNNLLKSLVVAPEGISPAFDPNTERYELTIGSDIEKLNIEAVADDEKAKVSISGNEKLELGKNTITIKVTAEDKSEKTYRIVVTKEKKEQLGLKELLIEGLPLEPEFEQTVYSYTVNLDKSDVTELNITATPSGKSAKVEVVGNTQLKPGENVITVLVTEKDETVTYQIKVSVPVPVEEKDTSIIKGIPNEKLYIYVGIGIVVICLIFVIISIIRHREYDDEDNDNYPQDNSDASQEQGNETKIEIASLSEEELPKSLRKNTETDTDQISEDRKKKIDEFTAVDDEYAEATTRRKKGKHF